MNIPTVHSIWQGALDVLRAAKHIIIVGYSLPRTDIYMQYFLKAAVGPNSDLRKIIVFNPDLFKEGEQSPQAVEMKKRYQECFSPQFSNRILFRPPDPPNASGIHRGSFLHFIQALEAAPEQLMFFP